MPVHNADIAAIFDKIANLLEIGDANPFRVRAYRNAAPYAAVLVRHPQGTSGVTSLLETESQAG